MRNNLPFNAIISLFSEKRCYNPVTEWNNFDFWRKWQAAVSEKTKKRRPKSPFFEKDCKRQPIRRFLGMRIVRRMASSVSSRRDSAPMPASRTSRRPRSRLLRNRRTSLRRKTRRPEGGVVCSWARRLSMYCSVWATFRCWRMMWWRALRRSSSSSRRRRARA